MHVTRNARPLLTLGHLLVAGVIALTSLAHAQELDLLRVVMNNAGVGSLDVLNARHTKATMYARMFGDFLVNIDPVDLSVQPGLATEWSHNEDATEFTFKLRGDVRFHDGTPFDAEAVKFNFDRIAAERLGASYSALGASRYAGTTVVDPYTVRVTFSAPYPQFYEQLALRLWFDSPNAVAQYGDDYGNRVVVGTGPYRVIEWVPDSHILLERNEEYAWGSPVHEITGPPYAKRIEIRGIVEPATRRAALESGQADIVMIEEGDVRDLSNDPRFYVEQELKAGTVRQIQFNLRSGPLTDVRVRQAIAYAIDREALVLAPRYDGAAVVAMGLLGAKNMGGAWPESLADVQYDYDPERASQLLEEAGWTLGSGGMREKDGQRLQLDMIFPVGVLSEVQPIQAMLADIGIDLKLSEMQTQAWFDAQSAGDFDLTIGSNSGTGLDLLNRIYSSGGTDNWWGLADPTLDSYFATVESGLDPQDRYDAVIEAQKYMIQQAYALPLLDVYYSFAVRNGISGIYYPAFSWPSFYQVRLD